MYGNISSISLFSSAWGIFKSEVRSRLIALFPPSLQERAAKTLSVERVARISSRLGLQPNKTSLILGGILTVAIVSVTYARNQQKNRRKEESAHSHSKIENTPVTQAATDPKLQSMLLTAQLTVQVQCIIYIPPSEMAEGKDCEIDKLNEQIAILEGQHDLATICLQEFRRELETDMVPEIQTLRERVEVLTKDKKRLQLEFNALKMARDGAMSLYLEQNIVMLQMVDSRRQQLKSVLGEEDENPLSAPTSTLPSKSDRRLSDPTSTLPSRSDRRSSASTSALPPKSDRRSSASTGALTLRSDRRSSASTSALPPKSDRRSSASTGALTLRSDRRSSVSATGSKENDQRPKIIVVKGLQRSSIPFLLTPRSPSHRPLEPNAFDKERNRRLSLTGTDATSEMTELDRALGI